LSSGGRRPGPPACRTVGANGRCPCAVGSSRMLRARRNTIQGRRAWVTAAGLLAAAFPALAQQSVGRGAPDPFEPDVIVGSEGKGMYAGAGIPPEHPPIFAAQEGAVPAGVTPLPHDIFTTNDFYQDRRSAERL